MNDSSDTVSQICPLKYLRDTPHNIFGLSGVSIQDRSIIELNIAFAARKINTTDG